MSSGTICIISSAFFEFLNVTGPANEIIQMVPDDKMLIETDSPYLAPEPVRGRRNNSQNVKYIAEKIATVKNLKIEEIAEITYNNAKNIFKIEE